MIENPEMFTDERYTTIARTCACVGLFTGCDSATVALVLGCALPRVKNTLTACYRLGYVNRERVGKGYKYHLGKSGRKFLSSERERVNEGVRLVLGRARLVPYARLELIGELEDGLR